MQFWYENWAGLLRRLYAKDCVFWKRVTCGARTEASSAWVSSNPACRTWDRTKASKEFWPMKPVLLDTGFIVALLDRSENFHKTCAQTVREVEAPLVTCEAVITESCFLLRNLSGASEAVIENIAAGIFQVPFQLSRDTLVSNKCCANKRTGRSIWRMPV
jgi:hypothetical protein